MIESYRFGCMRVEGMDHDQDLIVFAPGVKGPAPSISPNWWRATGHSLGPDDLQEVAAAHPRRLIIGQGAYARMAVPEETSKWLATLGIASEILPTEEAVRRYNELEASGERVVGCFHLTC
ncbi:MAG: MTH938/NDUFAF3 family protein [Planctomycetota bacterium]